MYGEDSQSERATLAKDHVDLSRTLTGMWKFVQALGKHRVTQDELNELIKQIDEGDVLGLSEVNRKGLRALVAKVGVASGPRQK